jgi:hypothetical protein
MRDLRLIHTAAKSVLIAVKFFSFATCNRLRTVEGMFVELSLVNLTRTCRDTAALVRSGQKAADIPHKKLYPFLKKSPI